MKARRTITNEIEEHGSESTNSEVTMKINEQNLAFAKKPPLCIQLFSRAHENKRKGYRSAKFSVQTDLKMETVYSFSHRIVIKHMHTH